MLSLPELARVHDRFLILSRIAGEHFGDSLKGKLLLRSDYDVDGIASVVAGSIAGAVSICVDGDGEPLRDGLRAGLIDFVVANLDEALRIVKNEIRRALPVSVGLTADPDSNIIAMIERGLQPDLVSGIEASQANIFVERGALPMPDPMSPDSGSALLEWTIANNPGQSMARIAQIAGGALDPARSDSGARGRWLEQAPRFMGRAFGLRQCVRMTDTEASAFTHLVRKEIPSVAIARDGHWI